MARLHHVNVNVAHGQSDEVAAFYVEALGFKPIPRPENGREGFWLEIGDGTQLHLSERDEHGHPQQHFALVLDDFEVITARLGDRFEPDVDVFETGGRGFTRDPAGNRIELIHAPART